MSVETGNPEVRRVELRELKAAGAPPVPRRVAALADVALPVTVELGRTTLRIRDLLSTGPGSVIELDRDARSPVDIFAGGRLIARGEVVVIGDMFGVRVTEVAEGIHNEEDAGGSGEQAA